MKKRVLVTGAAGFIGSHLVRHHLQAGDLVLGLDNFCSSDPKAPHNRRLTVEDYDRRQYVLFACDISKESEIHRSISFFFDQLGHRGFDLIYNFACPASPPRYQSMPIETMMTCVAGTKNVLDVAALHRSVVVHASTSEIYGDPAVSPQIETYKGQVNSYGPRACYDEGKRAAEALCYDYLQRGIDARVVRIFNTYGPHMDIDDGRVVTNFIKQALTRQPLTIFGDGQQTRSFCYVTDLIRGIASMGSLPSNPSGPINLGNPIEFTVYQLAQEVIKRLDGRIVRAPLPVDDPKQRCPDISRAQQLLGWMPTVQLAEGLDKTIEYVRNNVPLT